MYKVRSMKTGQMKILHQARLLLWLGDFKDVNHVVHTLPHICHGTALFNLCAPIALLRSSGLSYAPSVTCLHTELVLLLANVSDGCWGHDVKRVTESPAGAACTVMT